MPRQVERTIELKIAQYRKGRRRDFKPPRLEDLCDALWAAAPTVGLRHWPEPQRVEQGTNCVYLNRYIKRRRGDGRILEFVSYTHGTRPEQATPDLNVTETPISTSAMTDAQGRAVEVVHSVRVGVHGYSVVVEVNKGAGGAGSLGQVLTNLLRLRVMDDLPSISLIDVIGRDLRRAIDAGGGVDVVVARLVAESRTRNHHGALRMSALRRRVKGSQVVTATFESGDEVIDIDSALAIWKEGQEDDALDSVVLHLKDGQKVDRLGRFKERRRVPIQVTPQGRIAVTEVETAIWNYLDELRRPDESGWRIIDDDGCPVDATGMVGDGNDGGSSGLGVGYPVDVAEVKATL